jgi:hypothetical protein
MRTCARPPKRVLSLTEQAAEFGKFGAAKSPRSEHARGAFLLRAKVPARFAL